MSPTTSATVSPVTSATVSPAVSANHPALDLFVEAQAQLVAGDVDAASKLTNEADEAMRSVPIEDPTTHRALLDAHARLAVLATDRSAGLKQEMNRSGRARQAASRYR